MPERTKWTILTYVAAHNDLQELGERSLRQILRVGSRPEVMHGLLFDGAQGGARYVAGDSGKVLRQEQLADFDAGDPDRLVETAIWLFEQYPAEQYGLVLWSHGTGWQPEEIQEVAREVRGDERVDEDESAERSAAPGSQVLFRTTLAEIVKPADRSERAILFDDGTGHSLDTLELARVTAALQNTIGQPLDLLGMDACLMGNLEVAYQLRNSVLVLVASEELVPGHSWPYDLIYGELHAHPDWTAAEMADTIVQQYADHYEAFPPMVGDVTLVALDLQGIHELSDPVDRLATALAADMDNQADVLWAVQREAEQVETRNDQRKPTKFMYHLWDVAAVAARLTTLSTNTAVQKAAGDVLQALELGRTTVLAERHAGPWFTGIGGVSIYMMPPGKQERMSPYYSCLDLASDTKWRQMLASYHDYYL